MVCQRRGDDIYRLPEADRDAATDSTCPPSAVILWCPWRWPHRKCRRMCNIDHCLCTAHAFMPDAAAEYRDTVNEDSWIPSHDLDLHRLLHRLQMNDPAHTLLYVSAPTGDVIRASISALAARSLIASQIIRWHYSKVPAVRQARHHLDFQRSDVDKSLEKYSTPARHRWITAPILEVSWSRRASDLRPALL